MAFVSVQRYGGAWRPTDTHFFDEPQAYGSMPSTHIKVKAIILKSLLFHLQRDVDADRAVVVGTENSNNMEGSFYKPPSAESYSSPLYVSGYKGSKNLTIEEQKEIIFPTHVPVPKGKTIRPRLIKLRATLAMALIRRIQPDEQVKIALIKTMSDVEDDAITISMAETLSFCQTITPMRMTDAPAVQWLLRTSSPILRS